MRANVLGVAGKWAIHPAQIEVANRVFSPTALEAHARDVFSAYDAAVASWLGAVVYDGVMINAATARILQNAVQRAIGGALAQPSAIASDTGRSA